MARKVSVDGATFVEHRHEVEGILDNQYASGRNERPFSHPVPSLSSIGTAERDVNSCYSALGYVETPLLRGAPNLFVSVSLRKRSRLSFIHAGANKPPLELGSISLRTGQSGVKLNFGLVNRVALRKRPCRIY